MPRTRKGLLTHDAVCAVGGGCARGGAVVIGPTPAPSPSVEAGHGRKAGADICRRVRGVALQRDEPNERQSNFNKETTNYCKTGTRTSEKITIVRPLTDLQPHVWDKLINAMCHVIYDWTLTDLTSLLCINLWLYQGCGVKFYICFINLSPKLQLLGYFSSLVSNLIGLR